jgi:hypothetical protein
MNRNRFRPYHHDACNHDWPRDRFLGTTAPTTTPFPQPIPSLVLPGVDVGEEPEAPHRWDSDNDGHDWQPVDGELHLNFEAKRHWEPTMDLVIIDPDKFEELRKEMGAQWERMGGDLPTISEGGLTYARSWVKGKFCVIAEKKQGLCPHCGGVLEVSPWP